MSAPDAGQLSKKTIRSAALRGRIGRLQGFSIPLIIASLRVLENAIYEVVGENLLALEISFVISDVQRLSNTLTLQLEAAIRAYLDMKERQLLFDSSGEWAVWSCARCCWHVSAPPSERERVLIAKAVSADFDAHDCESYARENWLRVVS